MVTITNSKPTKSGTLPNITNKEKIICVNTNQYVIL